MSNNLSAENTANQTQSQIESQTSDQQVETESNSATAQETVASAQSLIKIEGQEFALDASVAADDHLLKTALSPHYPSIKNANITRETAATGQTVVSIVKRAEHKGSGEQKP